MKGIIKERQTQFFRHVQSILGNVCDDHLRGAHRSKKKFAKAFYKQILVAKYVVEYEIN